MPLVGQNRIRLALYIIFSSEAFVGICLSTNVKIAQPLVGQDEHPFAAAVPTLKSYLDSWFPRAFAPKRLRKLDKTGSP